MNSGIDTLAVMNSATIAPTIDATCETFRPRTLHVMALYDDLEALENAHAALESLTKTCGSRVRIESRAWNFNMLSRLDLRHASARIASHADVMIVAAQPSAALPAHVKSWMTTCLRQHSNTMPVFVAADAGDLSSSDSISTWYLELRSVASICSTPLLHHREACAKIEHHWTSLDYPTVERGVESAVRKPVYNNCRTRGGINE